jgi:hypothetical protein
VAGKGFVGPGALPAPSQPTPDAATTTPVVTSAPVTEPTPATVPATPIVAAAAPVATSAQSWSSLTAPAAPSVFSVNAFVNMGSGPYPDAATITTGNAQPWYDSPQVVGFFGGPPSASQQAAFTSTVMARVDTAFALSGVPVTLTDNPNVTAAHAVSLVSGSTAQLNPGAIGMTEIGGNGFSFIDQEAKTASSLDRLEWLVAHNVAHELMLAFGVGESYDQSGHYLEARNADPAMMFSAAATFSPSASQALNQALANTPVNPSSAQGAQVIAPQPVPEAGALALWAALMLVALLRWGRTLHLDDRPRPRVRAPGSGRGTG